MPHVTIAMACQILSSWEAPHWAGEAGHFWKRVRSLGFGTAVFCQHLITADIYIYIYIYIYVRLSKLLVWRIDINIIWKGPIANHSFVAILPSLGTID